LGIIKEKWKSIKKA